MRDIHGRYTTLKEISDNGPSWARGCPNCQHGIVSAPELTGACSLHLERLVQAVGKQLVFCECKAGQAYRVTLLNLRQGLIEEARKDPRMQEQAHRLTHPDIEVARAAVEAAYVMAPAPTIHYEAAMTPAMPPVAEQAVRA